MTGEVPRRRMNWKVVRALSTAAAALAAGVAVVACGNGAAAKQAYVTGTIELNRSSVRTGGTVSGKVVFRNRTSRAKVLLRTCGTIDGFYAVTLRASDGYGQGAAFSLVGCLHQQAMLAKPGTTIYRFTVSARYTECAQSARHQRPKNSRYWTPLCLKASSGERNIMPPLPPGHYTALFFPDGRWSGPTVKSARLVVTRT